MTTVDPAAAAAAGATGTTPAAPEFKAADAVTFLTEHGVDAKSLEGVAEADLRTRYESARVIAEKAAARATPKAPEKYEFKAAGDAKVDEAIATEVAALAKEFGLPQDKAQKLYDSRLAAGDSQMKQLADRVTATHKEWQAASRADKEFGGEAFEANLGIAAQAAKQFADPEFSKLMDTTGLGDHPAVIRLFYKLGKQLQNDKTLTGGGGPNQGKSAAELLFPKSGAAS